MLDSDTIRSIQSRLCVGTLARHAFGLFSARIRSHAAQHNVDREAGTRPQAVGLDRGETGMEPTIQLLHVDCLGLRRSQITSGWFSIHGGWLDRGFEALSSERLSVADVSHRRVRRERRVGASALTQASVDTIWSLWLR
jgi:hypothetical protein